MGKAVFAGQPFRIDPTSISWPFRVKTREQNTVGGRVVQVLGADLGDMTVSGTFGVGGWQEQLRFLRRMEAVGDRVADPATSSPERFLWPGKGWDFLVYLKSFSEGGGNSIDMRVENIVPRWTIVLHIVEDNVGLRRVAQDVFISRLSAGLGWQQTKYNGPLGYAEVESTINAAGATTVADYLAIRANQGESAPAPTGGQ